MSKSASPVRLQADLESLLRGRIALGLAGDLSSKSLAAIVQEEMLLPIPGDGRPEQVSIHYSPTGLCPYLRKTSSKASVISS